MLLAAEKIKEALTDFGRGHGTFESSEIERSDNLELSCKVLLGVIFGRLFYLLPKKCASLHKHRTLTPNLSFGALHLEA